MTFKLGGTHVDCITRFKGVAVGHVRYISGCNQVLLAPEVDADGKLRESQWFDEQRLVLQDTPVVVLENGATPGFDKAAPKR